MSSDSVERAAAEYAQEAELAFEHAHGAGEAVAREARREHAALGRAAEVEALHHGAGAGAGEFHQPAGERAGDAERIAHALGVEARELAAGDRGAERAGRARRVEAAALVAVVRGAPDADHDLRAGDEGGDQLAPADAALLGHCEAGSEQGRAGMHAGARPGQIVHLERVRERAVGQGGGGRMHARAVQPENAALAACTVSLREGDDDPAPGQVVAEDDGRNGVRDALLGALDDVAGDVGVAQGEAAYSASCVVSIAMCGSPEWIGHAVQARMTAPARSCARPMRAKQITPDQAPAQGETSLWLAYSIVWLAFGLRLISATLSQISPSSRRPRASPGPRRRARCATSPCR